MRLLENDLDHARVLLVLGGEAECAVARLDIGEGAHPSLSLRDDLVRHHQHVAIVESVRRSRDKELG